MKYLLLVFVIAFAGACGDDSPCEECGSKLESAINDACDNQTDCQFCTCFADGQVVTSDGMGCEDPPDGDGGGECTGQAKEAAEKALEDGTCDMGAADLVTLSCTTARMATAAQEELNERLSCIR